MANVKKENGTQKGGGAIAGIIIVACIFVGWIIWNFIMGNGANFEGGVNTGHPLPGNYLAVVDATKSRDLAKLYEIRVYPTFKVMNTRNPINIE